MPVTYHLIINHDVVEDVFDDETWQDICAADDRPAADEYRRVTVANEDAFAAWMAARRDYEATRQPEPPHLSNEDRYAWRVEQKAAAMRQWRAWTRSKE